jgi:hypothetical protein
MDCGTLLLTTKWRNVKKRTTLLYGMGGPARDWEGRSLLSSSLVSLSSASLTLSSFTFILFNGTESTTMPLTTYFGNHIPEQMGW